MSTSEDIPPPPEVVIAHSNLCGFFEADAAHPAPASKIDYYRSLIFSSMWSRTRPCSSCGLNKMTSAS